jgi:endogenous inhibitor of DNA gyrase (YacG/DUF329 family)
MNDRPKPPPTGPAPVRITAAACTRCGAPVQARFRPFCSQRCADIDLGHWISGNYRVETQEETNLGDDDAEP